MDKALIIGILVIVFVDVLLVAGIVIIWLVICFNLENDYMWRFYPGSSMHCTVFDFVFIYHTGSYFPYWKRTNVLC